MKRTITSLVLGLLVLAACGGGGSGGSGPGTVSLTRTVTLMSNADLDGFLREDGRGGWAWRPGITAPLTGVVFDGCEYMEYRQFYTFDHSALPHGARIVRATLRLYQTQVVGDPYGVLGNIVVDQVHYGPVIQLEQFDGNVFNRNIGTLSTDASIRYHELVVTSAVRIDREDGRTQSQFRLRIDIPPFRVFDEQSDYVRFTDAEGGAGDTVHVPALILRYTLP